MKKLLFVLCLLVLIPTPALAMTWKEFVEEYGAMPPPPPDATNTDVWPFDTPTFEPGVSRIVQGDYSDGGQSISDMNAQAFLDSIDWTGQEVWKYS